MTDHQQRLGPLVDTLQQLALLHPASLAELERLAKQMLVNVRKGDDGR